MATPQDADLIIKLYDLRREKTMRKARKFVVMEFLPQNFDDFKTMLGNPEQNAYFRMVTTYWDMACAMVNHNALDRGLFTDVNGEYLAVWAKVSDDIDGLRKIFGPQYLGNLEKLVASQPNGAERVAIFKEKFKQWAAARAEKS